jgi:hypothetical protein
VHRDLRLSSDDEGCLPKSVGARQRFTSPWRVCGAPLARSCVTVRDPPTANAYLHPMGLAAAALNRGWRLVLRD